MKEHSSIKTDFMIILFGNIDYDGRVQRLLEAIEPLGKQYLLDYKCVNNKNRNHRLFSILAIGKARIVFRHVLFWLKTVTKALAKRPKVVIGCDYYAAFPALFVSRITGAMLIYDAHELIIPETGKHMSIRGLFWYILEKLTIKQADMVIAANLDRAHLMMKHYSLKDLPTVVRNIYQSENGNIKTDEANKLYSDLLRRYPGERLILYQGNVSLSRGITRILDALNYLPEYYRLIIAGDGPDLQELKIIGKSFEQKGRFTVLGRVENRFLIAIARFADVGIITYPFEGLNNIYCSPNKLYEYANAGLPVVATNQPPIKQAIETFRIGELVTTSDSPRQIAQVLMKVAENKKDYQQQLKSFLEANRWEDEALRLRIAMIKVIKRI